MAFFDPTFAVMVVLPAFLAVTFPPLTVATAVLLEDQVTDLLSVVFAGLYVTVRIRALPTVSDALDLLREIDFRGLDAALTVTLQVAFFDPTFAVMVVLPAFLAVTLPPLTVATAVLLLDQVVSLLSVVLAGVKLTERFAVVPTLIVRDVLESVILLRGMFEDDGVEAPPILLMTFA